MVNRRRFCIVCGFEETVTAKLSDGLCPKCLVNEKPGANVREIPTIKLCRLCGSLQEKGKWFHPTSDRLEEDLLALLRRISTRLNWVEEGEIPDVSIKRMPTSIGSNSVIISASIKVRASSQQHPSLTREFDTRVCLVPAICPYCSLMKQQYYEATLQIRTFGRKMASVEKEKLISRINSLVEKSSRKNKQAFISKYEDKLGGFDVYLGSRQVAYSVASKFRAMKGTVTKETFKAGKVDKSTGKRSDKVTILIRMPDQEIDDFAYENMDQLNYARN